MIPEEVTKLIGKTEDPVIYEVEKGAIRRYADAADDPNLLYRDEEFARNSRYGSIIAPPGFLGWPLNQGGGIVLMILETMAKHGYPYLLDGGVEFEFMLPVRAGDVLVSSGRVADIYGRESKGAKMVFCIIEAVFTNQNGAVAFKMRNTLICR